MIVTISPEKIKEIAEQLQSGFICWYHIPTGDILIIPDEMKGYEVEEEIWKDDLKEIKKKKKECVLIKGLNANEEFGIMASFAENEVDDPEVRSRLIHALNQRKPFMHFKSAIHYNDKYLKAWYAFKQESYEKHVITELEVYNLRNTTTDKN